MKVDSSMILIDLSICVLNSRLCGHTRATGHVTHRPRAIVITIIIIIHSMRRRSDFRAMISFCAVTYWKKSLRFQERVRVFRFENALLWKKYIFFFKTILSRKVYI